MSPTIYTKASATVPPVDRREILRYARAGEDSPETVALLSECLDSVADRLSFRVCYGEFPLTRREGMLDLGFAVTASRSLSQALAGCDGAIIFGATVGIGLDRAIATAASRSPARALMLDAIGCERIEALCDLFCEELAEQKQAEGLTLTPRFSPGYGDLPLSLQRDLFRVLDCPRRIGLSLNESLLMSPQKSVTAIVGIGREGAKPIEE